MPLYPYRCTACGYRFEKIQHFDSEPETKCPKCGGALERPLTAPGLQFKGAGWYVTDYASKSSGSASESASATAEAKTAAEGTSPAGGKSSAAETTSAPAAPAAAASGSAAKSSETKS